MKLIINRKNRAESITLDFELTATVDDLFQNLYKFRSKSHVNLSFNEYQQFISVYQCILYGDRFKKILVAGTNLVDYQLEDPCNLTWEEFAENQYLHTNKKNLFWQANTSNNPTQDSELKKPSVALMP